MSKLKLTPVLIGMDPVEVEAGNLCKGAIFGRLYIVGEDPYINIDLPQQFLLLSDRAFNEGDDVFSDYTAHKAEKYCVKNGCQRIEAAYPTIEGLPPISPEFMKMYCENPDGEVWCEMQCHSTLYNQACDCCEVCCISSPRLESGFIALEIVPPQEGEILDIFSKMSDTPSKPADVPSEVMNFPEWFKSNYKGQSYHDFAQNRLCTEYAKYYHTALSQHKPEVSHGVSAGATIGVGDGSGDMYVRGSYDAVKLLQGKLLELEQLRSYKQADKVSESHTFKYLTIEMNRQIEKFKKLGINTTGQTFEQMVNTAIFMCEQADKVVDWDKIESDFHADMSMPHIPNWNLKKFISFVKSRLSTSGVSDEKVACEFGHWLGLCTEFQNGQLFLMRTDIGYELPATEITFEDAFKLFKSPTA